METGNKENLPIGLEAYYKGELMRLREFSGEVGILDERSKNKVSIIKARIFLSKDIDTPLSVNMQASYFYKPNDNLFASLFHEALGFSIGRVVILEDARKKDLERPLGQDPQDIALEKLIDQYNKYNDNSVIR